MALLLKPGEVGYFFVLVSLKSPHGFLQNGEPLGALSVFFTDNQYSCS
jgi:hypothetical protein